MSARLPVLHNTVIPAKAGIHTSATSWADKWIPACAGMTFSLFVQFPATAAEAPPGTSSCSGCHPANASVETPVAPLAGRPATLTVAAMQAFRAGQLPTTVMDRIAKGFSDDEIAAIASWYAAQPEPARK